MAISNRPVLFTIIFTVVNLMPLSEAMGQECACSQDSSPDSFAGRSPVDQAATTQAHPMAWLEETPSPGSDRGNITAAHQIGTNSVEGCRSVSYCPEHSSSSHAHVHHGASHSHHRHHRADTHAPAGLMGGHVHQQGSWMLEYKYMNMYMDGNRAGTVQLTPAEALTVGQAQGTNNGATPTQMTMEMHMMHVMYGLTDRVTLYAMPTWSSLTMDHLRNNPFPPNAPLAGTPFTTHNSGIADLPIGALWKAYEGCTDELIINFGMRLPTGDLDRRTTIPTGGNVSQEFPYPMRLGSGTFDFRPGVTYRSYYDHGSVGLQYQGIFPVGRNDHGYSLSNEHRLNAWYSWTPCDRLALSFRVENIWRGNIHGADTHVNPAIISTNRRDMRAGQWTNFGYGVSARVGNGYLLNCEAVQPIYQNLDGVQLQTQWTLFSSISKSY